MRLLHTLLLFSCLLVVVPSSMAQDSPQGLPKVVQHSEPVYPQIARTAHIQGEVRVKISTDGESVRDAVAESGPALLRKAAEDNARTWRFAAHTPGSFYVTFNYKLLSGGTEVSFLESPAVVQVASPVGETSIYYANIGLGKWKAQLKGPHGKSWQIFSLYCSGPNGDWLDGEALSSKGKNTEIDFGHKNGNLLGFTIKLTQPNGREVNTFLIGMMTPDKIAGTFVDDEGTRGEWAAVRVPETQASQ